MSDTPNGGPSALTPTDLQDFDALLGYVHMAKANLANEKGPGIQSGLTLLTEANKTLARIAARHAARAATGIVAVPADIDFAALAKERVRRTGVPGGFRG